MLTAILVILIVGIVLLLFFINEEQKQQARWIAAGATGVCLILSLLVFAELNQPDNLAKAQAAGRDGRSYFIQEINVPWLPSLGINYHVGVDGVTAPMILLTGLVSFSGVLISWKIEDRTREFMAFFLLLVTGVYGVFISVDLFLLFFWYELSIFPMYLLIVTWGWAQTREYAAMKLTLYILIGSVVALVGTLVIYFAAGSFFSQPQNLQRLQQITGNAAVQPYSFDFSQLELATRWQQITGQPGPFDSTAQFGVSIARFWFPFIFIGFGVLAGLFPFHNWSPDGHVAAPTAVSMIHAGVLMKLGAFAALRVGVQLLPDGARVHLPWIILLALINVVYGAFIAFRQRDFKYVIGFSSVSHMGLVSLGFASMNLVGLTGAGLQMFSHGAMTALFFACVGMVYDQAHTRDIPSLGGFVTKMPWVTVAFILGGLTSMGLPGLSGFIAEFPIFAGIWKGPVFSASSLNLVYFPTFNYYPIIVILASLGIIVTGCYVLMVVQRVFFGEFNATRFPSITGVTVIDKTALVLLGSVLIILGVYPQIMSTVIEAGMSPIVTLLARR